MTYMVLTDKVEIKLGITTQQVIRLFQNNFAEVGVYAQAKPCAITSNLVVSPYPSSALGYRYNLDTYSADKEVPAVPSDKVAIVNRSSVPFSIPVNRMLSQQTGKYTSITKQQTVFLPNQ